MLLPKKTKYRKAHKGRVPPTAKGATELAFGEYALKSLDCARIDSRQIEAARRAVARAMKREGQVWIRIFPDIPVSAKPAEVRMGKGKGNVEKWVARVSPGRILFELDGVSNDVAANALFLASRKLPVRTKIVKRYE